MHFDGPFFILGVMMICTVGWLVNNWIRAKHGYALEDEWGGKTERAQSQETLLLVEQNDRLTKRLATMEDRLIVLEKIVTDEGYDVARQIEALRNIPGNGQSLRHTEHTQ